MTASRIARIRLAAAFLALGSLVSIPATAPARASDAGCVERYASFLEGDRKAQWQALRSGDAGAWNSWIRRALQSGAGPGETAALSAAASRLDPELGRTLVQEIVGQYPKLAKNGPAAYGPKRVADILLNAILRPHEPFFTMKERGWDVDRAMTESFARVRDAFPASERGGLGDVRDLKAIARIIQERLKGEARITVFGSLANARARLGSSDMDWVHSEGHTIPFSEIQQSIQDHLRGRHGKGLLGFELIPESKLDTARMGTVNPIQLRITADKVEVLVYPPPKPEDPGFVTHPFVHRWF